MYLAIHNPELLYIAKQLQGIKLDLEIIKKIILPKRSMEIEAMFPLQQKIQCEELDSKIKKAAK